jgi:hypothetical protein
MARRVKRRETEIFSISFLDCITCGLGSVVLLLVLSNIRTPIEESPEDAHQRILKLQDELIEIKGQKDILNRDLVSREEQLSDVKGPHRAAERRSELAARQVRRFQERTPKPRITSKVSWSRRRRS